MSKIIIGPCRLSFVHVWQPQSIDGDNPKYSAAILIPKSDKKTIAAINKAVEAAIEEGKTSKFNGKVNGVALPLRDGDDKDREEYDGMMYLNAKSTRQPGMVNRNGQKIVDPDEIYSGVYAYVSVTFYPYAISGSKGIAVALNNIMKHKDGERLAGGADAETDFKELIGAGADDDYSELL